MANEIKSNPPKTMLTISLGFVVLYMVTTWKWFLIISLGVGVIGILSDQLSRYVEFLWFKLAWLLGLIVPNILLSIIFYLFLFPIALLSKVFGNKDALMLRKPSETVWKEYDREIDTAYFEKTW